MRARALRWMYSLLLYCVAPWLLIRIFLRARKNPLYLNRLGERFGFYSDALPACIWLHAVSLGESIAATPLIEALLKRYPNMPLLVTNTTLSGSLRVAHVFGDRVKQVYLPYDFPLASARFIERYHPIVGILFETELWPNLIASCKKKQIPLALINARLSEKSARGYQKISSLTRWMLSQLDVVGAHAKADGERLLALGLLPEKLIVTGNIKFDLQITPDLLNRALQLRTQFSDRHIWIAASTHAGEEEILLRAHALLREKIPNALLILVPRHPERFDSVAHLIQSKMISFARRTQAGADLKTVSVYLGDTLGELLLLYACSDIAFVGGSLIPRGGHNILEPAALGKPVLMGEHMFNFADISTLLVAGKGAAQVQNAENIFSQLYFLFSNPDQMKTMGECAFAVLEQHRGALQKQLDLVSELIEKQSFNRSYD